MTITFDLYAALRILLGVVALALLTSMGGAGIYAAPVTLPLLWLATRGASRAGHVALNVVAALTAAEVAWAFGYEIGGAAEWALPVVAAVAVGAAYQVSQRRLSW
jgi:hypothetical protein